MIFDHTDYFLLLLAVPVFIFFSIRAYRQSRKWLYSFSGSQTKSGPYLRSTILLCLTFVFLTISLAEPRIQYEKVYFNRSGIEIVLGIDVSKSMLAEDVFFPSASRRHFQVLNRLNRARYFAINLLSELNGVKIGTYIFADKGVEIVPITRDYGYCRYIFKHIDDTGITVPGSNLGAAIRTGRAILQSSTSKAAKFIVLISDGENISLDPSELFEEAQRTANQGIKIYAIGIGSEKGALIPIRNQEATSYYIDDGGSYLKTRLVQDTLKNIAGITGGQYFRATDKNAPKLLMEAVLRAAEGAEETKYIEFTWFYLSLGFLVTAIVCFIPGIISKGIR